MGGGTFWGREYCGGGASYFGGGWKDALGGGCWCVCVVIKLSLTIILLKNSL